jgi:predicted Zn-dependent peptidase
MLGGGGKYSARRCREIIDRFHECNAETTLCETRFTAGSLKDDIGLWLDFVSEQAFIHAVNTKLLEEEKRAVLREIADYKGVAGYSEERQLRKFIFGKNSPFCIEIFGKEDAVSSLTAENIRQFRRTGFNASNAELFIAGGLPDNIERMIAEYFGPKKQGNTLRRLPTPAPQLKCSKTIYAPAPDLVDMDRPELSTAEIRLCFLAPSMHSPEMYSASILNDLLGERINSRIFSHIRRKLGLAYRLKSYYDGSDNQGIIEVAGRVLAKEVEKAIDALFKQIKMASQGINKTHIENIKRAELYDIISSFETPQGILNAIEMEEDYGITPREHLARLSAVTLDDLREIARKYFPAGREAGGYALLVRDPLRR